jgi:hypothetical protein
MLRREFLSNGALLTAGLGAGALAARSGPSADAAPQVTGPVKGGRRGWPLGSYPTDLGRFGYVEEEYFLSGVANSYRPTGNWSKETADHWTVTADGKWTVEVAGSKPYKTRLLVHRPKDPSKFNGSVLVEWINVSPGYDNLIVPSDGLYEGFAYVGVAAQYIGVHGYPGAADAERHGLTQWDPERYGSLVHPGDSFSFDIYTHAARVIRHQSGVNFLTGLKVRKIIATGASQSAGRFRTYINALHLSNRVYDAYVPFLDFANAVGFGDETTVIDPAPGQKQALRAPVRYRDDIDVPIMIVNSEQESTSYRGDRGFCMQPDTDRFRMWEVAGAPHSPDIPSDPVVRAVTAKRDELVRGGAPTANSLPGAQVTSWHCTVAAYYHVHAWINGGPAPPHQPKLRFREAPTAELIRDTLGIGTGGIRLPDTEVPVMMNTGLSNDPRMRRNRGVSQPFTDEQIKGLYPTHEDYVRKVTAATEVAASAGIIRPYRVREYIEQAKAAKIPST